MRKEIFDRDNVVVQGREKQVGGLPEGWRDSTWGDEISLEYGKALRSYEGVQGAVRVFGSNGPIGWTDTALAEGPGIILGRKGAYRGVKFSKKPFFVIDTAYYVKPKSALDMRWLYYAIVHHKLGEIDDGSPIPSTTRSAVYVRDVEIPPLPEQKAIAAILGALDDKIEANRKMNATLEGIARALFKSWFVDFDPVRAKAEGRPSGLPAALDALFPGGFTDSPLGEIPMGWEVKSLGDIVQPKKGKSITKKTVTDGTIPVVAGGLEPAYFHNQSNSKAPTITISASGANAGFVRLYNIDVWASDCSIINKTITPFIYSVYVFLKINQREIYNMQQGAAQPHIYPSDIMRLGIVNPPYEIWETLEKIISPLFEKIGNNDLQNQTLATLRDTLLPKLISGQIRVGDVEKLVEGAA